MGHSSDTDFSGAQPQMPQNFGMPGGFMPPAYLPPQLAQQAEQLRAFWVAQMAEIGQVGTDPAEFKNHQLPLARIKKVRAPADLAYSGLYIHSILSVFVEMTTHTLCLCHGCFHAS